MGYSCPQRIHYSILGGERNIEKNKEETSLTIKRAKMCTRCLEQCESERDQRLSLKLDI